MIDNELSGGLNVNVQLAGGGIQAYYEFRGMTNSSINQSTDNNISPVWLNGFANLFSLLSGGRHVMTGGLRAVDHCNRITINTLNNLEENIRKVTNQRICARLVWQCKILLTFCQAISVPYLPNAQISLWDQTKRQIWLEWLNWHVPVAISILVSLEFQIH